MFPPYSCIAVLLVCSVSAYDNLLAFNSPVEVESRTIDEIYQAALLEGGTVTSWMGGDEKNQEDAVKQAFEARFPGMTLNLTVDVSKYHDGNIDQQLANGNVYVDSVILQTLHDYPRWKREGALLNYAPIGFDQIYPDFRDLDAAYYGVFCIGWEIIWNTEKLGGDGLKEFTDFLKPEFKDRIVLTYPNDDDAILLAFDLIMEQYGYGWFEELLKQNPVWVRGAATPATLIAQPNSSFVASFTSSVGLIPSPPFNISFPSEGKFMSWPQTAAILKDSPHPEGAKLLHNFLLSKEFQGNSGLWSTRADVPAPNGYSSIMDMPTTNPTYFAKWMANRERVERLRFFFESKLGTAQGLSPLEDSI